MIGNKELLKSFEDDLISKNSLSYADSMNILEALWKEAVELDVLPPADPLEGIETKIRIAKVLNRCSAK